MNTRKKQEDKPSTTSFGRKVVIVTGSSRGIGKAIALAFLRSGAQVVINGRDPVRLQRTLEEFSDLGYGSHAVTGDLADPRTCDHLVREAAERFGRIDILVNNAGGGFRGAMADTSPEVFRKVIDGNLMSAVNCSLAALPEIRKSKGSIVFISSLSGIRGLPLNGPYCVAKMGLTALAQTLRLELHGSGVHIGLVMVGLTDFDEDKRVTGADGSLVAISRKSHQTRQEVAEAVLRTVKKRKFCIVLTNLGKLTHFFQKISPGFVEWTLLRSAKSGAYNR
jgi:NAD(P)-dependent dehydrogenase (short-subunit alcohol dehydrogenase family)